MTHTDFAGSQFRDDEREDGSRNAGLFPIQLFNTAKRPRTFYPVIDELDLRNLAE
jgi:hypothetical protein